MAGKSTLNRLELSKLEPTRYHKISHNPVAIRNLFVDLFLEAHARAPRQIILDLDATDDPLHGEQEGRFFHGYYDCYCYLPLYVFCGHHLLLSKLRCADVDAAAGAVEEVARLIARIRACWPRTCILLRADSGFARDELMTWCEANGVDFVFGLQKNERLIAMIEGELAHAEAKSRRTGEPARRFKSFMWTTRTSWSRSRRVVAKAEWTKGEGNPRFVVTSLRRNAGKAKDIYEKIYCARGDMENRIKECQLDLYADRTSAATMRANQLRLWFYSMAYVLLRGLRRIGLHDSDLAQATCGTIRLKLLKIGAWFASASAASKSPWRRPVRPLPTGAAPQSASRSPPSPARRPHDTRRRAATIARHTPMPTETQKQPDPLTAHLGATHLHAFRSNAGENRLLVAKSIGSVRNPG